MSRSSRSVSRASSEILGWKGRVRRAAAARVPGQVRRRSRQVAVALSTAALTLVVTNIPRAADACTVCTAGRDEENAAAFLISTIFMSVTPLLAIGAVVYLLWRRMRKFEAEQESRRQAQGTKPDPAPRDSAGNAVGAEIPLAR